MDPAKRHMLADLGLATRTAVINSVSARDYQDANMRSMRSRRVRPDPHVKDKLNMWKTFHTRDDARQAYTAAAPPGRPSPPLSSAAPPTALPAPMVSQTTTNAVPPSIPPAPSRPMPSATSRSMPPALPSVTAREEQPPNKQPDIKISDEKPGSFSFRVDDTGGNAKECEIKLRMPVEACVTLKSKSDYIGVLELATMMEGLALAMQTTTYQVMTGVRDDGTGLFDIDDVWTDLARADRA